MISITELATEKLSAYLAYNKINSPIRIAAKNGCGGSSLQLALDDKNDSDYTRENENFTMLIDQDLSQSCGKVMVDYIEESSGCGSGEGGGFSLTSERPLPKSESGCGGSCSSSGCGC